MPQKTTYEVDGANFSDFEGLIEEFNRGFICHVGGDWNGNLDGFNDYLYWPDDKPYTLRWHNSGKSRRDLGHVAMAEWLEGNLARCHPDNRAEVQQRLDNANKGAGPTFFDFLIGIIRDNSEYVDLMLD